MKTASIVFVISICVAIATLCEAQNQQLQDDKKISGPATVAKTNLPANSEPAKSPRSFIGKWACRAFCRCVTGQQPTRICKRCCTDRPLLKNNRVKRDSDAVKKNKIKKPVEGVKVRQCKKCDCKIRKWNPYCRDCCRRRRPSKTLVKTVRSNREKRGLGKKLKKGLRKIGKGLKKVAAKVSGAFGGTVPVYKKSF